MNIKNKQKLIKFCIPDVSAAENLSLSLSLSLFPCFSADTCNDLFESELVSVFTSCRGGNLLVSFGLLHVGSINKLKMDSVVYFEFGSGLI